MDFWEHQRQARRQTVIYVTIFVLMTIGVAVGLELLISDHTNMGYKVPGPRVGVIFAGITFLVAGFNYLQTWSMGGGHVARSVGGTQVDPNTRDFHLRQLMNIVEECAVASNLPMPEVYVLDCPSINAFAAGVSPEKAAVAVTRGALQQLNRQELQGVMAHEFGHIRNGDMRLSIRLAAMVMGFFFVMYIGFRVLQFSGLGGNRGGGRGGKGGNPLPVIALGLIVAGIVTWFFGKILQSMVSRQREYLADASAVEFTRDPQGLKGALLKIKANAQQNRMPKEGGAYAHLYFDHQSWFGSLFATHPPVDQRIARLEGK